MSTIRFKTAGTPFFDHLKNGVDSYFNTTRRNRWGNGLIIVKAIVLLTSFFILYISLVFGSLSLWMNIGACVLLGLTLAGIGFNLMHDGAHGSFSDKKWLNELMAHTLNMVGGDVSLWKTKHNVIHHSFTNIEGHDDDINIQPMMRTNENQPRYKIHRFQHIYGYVLYCLTYISWVWIDDVKKYRTQQVGITKLRKFTFINHFTFWATKLSYVATFIVLPIIFKGLIAAILGYLIVAMVTGIVIAVVFQLAHVVESVSFNNPEDTNGVIEEEWAIHQINTTSNFATRNPLVTLFTGGLNYQVEHHLFPRISHVHYPALNKIVRETCEKFGVQYNEYGTVIAAVRSHTRHLKTMGIAD